MNGLKNPLLVLHLPLVLLVLRDEEAERRHETKEKLVPWFESFYAMHVLGMPLAL